LAGATTAELAAAKQIIADAETYLDLGGKKLKDIMDEGDPANGVNPHADYIKIPNNFGLIDLIG